MAAPFKTAVSAPKKTRGISDWKSLEEAIQDELVARQRRQPLLFHRFYDTRSAGAYLPAQPADFGVLLEGRWTYLEAKYSGAAETLRSVFSNAVSDQQLASAKLAARAKGSYWFLFYSGVSRCIELWPGEYCAGQRDKGSPLEVSRRLGVYDSLPLAIGDAISKASSRLTYKGV